MTDESGWVIESVNKLGQIVYWDGHGTFSFSPDHLEAVRFARKQDAERVFPTICYFQPIKIAEHLWVPDLLHGVLK